MRKRDRMKSKGWSLLLVLVCIGMTLSRVASSNASGVMMGGCKRRVQEKGPREGSKRRVQEKGRREG